LLIADSREQTKPIHPLRIHLTVLDSKEGTKKNPLLLWFARGEERKQI
jgi:hypothetical protein